MRISASFYIGIQTYTNGETIDSPETQFTNLVEASFDEKSVPLDEEFFQSSDAGQLYASLFVGSSMHTSTIFRKDFAVEEDNPSLPVLLYIDAQFDLEGIEDFDGIEESLRCELNVGDLKFSEAFFEEVLGDSEEEFN